MRLSTNSPTRKPSLGLTPPAFSITANGSANFSGIVSASFFTGTVANFSGRIVVGAGTGTSEFKDLVRFSTGGAVQVEDGRIIELYDSGNVFRGDIRGTDAGDTPASCIWARGDWSFNGDIGFYGTAPVAQQTGVAVTASAIHAALVNLGLITA